MIGSNLTNTSHSDMIGNCSPGIGMTSGLFSVMLRHSHDQERCPCWPDPDGNGAVYFPASLHEEEHIEGLL